MAFNILSPNGAAVLSPFSARGFFRTGLSAPDSGWSKAWERACCRMKGRCDEDLARRDV